MAIKEHQENYRKQIIETLPEERKAIKTVGWQEIISQIEDKGKQELDTNIISYKPIYDEIQINFKNLQLRGIFDNSTDCFITEWGRKFLNRILPKQFYADVTIDMREKYHDYYIFSSKLSRKSLNNTMKILNKYMDALNAGNVEKARKERFKLRQKAYGKHAW
jgi:hypothetical protein